MVLIERIVRPHLPVDNNPPPTTPVCQTPAATTTAKFNASSTSQSAPSVKTYNSSWSCGYKTYMTKKEKEKDQCKEDGEQIVGSSSPTGKKSK